MRVIVVGGGPSAPQFYDWIKASGLPVIACSTMLLPLQRAGIKVDVTVIIDPSAVMVFHFRNAITDGELVYNGGIYEMVLPLWKGPRRQFDRMAGSSVLNVAVDVAVDMGATEVHLVGADFAYTNGKSHADGVTTAYEVREWLEVDGWRTESGLVHFRDQLREYIAKHPDVLLIRHGEGLPL
jgi:hypothetical protein